MKPSDFVKAPMDSVLQSFESETVAVNIMVILKRTGDVFRPLGWSEYKEERLKDGQFSDSERPYFEQVIDYCRQPETAVLFSPVWGAVRQSLTEQA